MIETNRNVLFHSTVALSCYLQVHPSMYGKRKGQCPFLTQRGSVNMMPLILNVIRAAAYLSPPQIYLLIQYRTMWILPGNMQCIPVGWCEEATKTAAPRGGYEEVHGNNGCVPRTEILNTVTIQGPKGGIVAWIVTYEELLKRPSQQKETWGLLLKNATVP